MIRIQYRLAGLLGCALLLASCGAGKNQGADEELLHEKEETTEQEVQDAGWTIDPSTQKSAHPLADNLRETVEVTAPDTARKFRIRFKRIDMESGYDYLIIQDEWGTELERITGRHRNYVSRTVSGTKAKIVLETDEGVRSWGFEIDQIRHRGCAHNPPGDLSLRAQQSCTQLREGIRQIATREVRRRFTDGHFGGPILFRNRPLANAEAAQPAAPAHSETNTQVAGVDEADIVKTDGNFTYAIAGRQVRVFKTWPADETALVHAIDIEGWAKEFFLENGKLTVLSGVQGDNPIVNPCRGRICPMMMMPIWWRPDAYTKVTVIDMRGGAPRVESETLLAGQYQTARRVGSSVRLVLQRELSWPNISYYPEGVEWNSPEFDRRMDELEADAIRIVRDRELSDWLPKSYRIENGRRVALPVTCQDFYLPNGSDEIGLTSVVTLDLSSPVPGVQDTSLVSRANIVYQSADNLYFTANHNWSCWEDAQKVGQFTYVHKLDVSRPEKSTYLASGGVVGGIENQFAMDEHGGFLRVASTNNRWGAQTPEEQSQNRVYVLGARGAKLEVVGQTPALAPGERIFSSRFLGDRGFVVTFRQVDPLFTLDLSDPRNPRVVGELKIPGFSTYLHQLDANHLFALGNDFEEDGRTRNGVALTIFDVSNMAAPRMIHKAVVGTTNGGSEALYDHKAFTMWRQPGQQDATLAIPFTDWIPNDNPAEYWGSFKSTLKVFRVSPTGILGIGEVDHSDLFKANDSNEWGWYYQPNIRRGVFIEGYTYAVSDAGIRVAETANLRNVVATVAARPVFEQPVPVDPPVTKEASGTPNLAIPDADSRGVTTTLSFADDIEISSLSVEIEIKHSYRGDLVVTLEHDGVTETLHNKTGGAADDLIKTFVTERFARARTQGTWTLKVADVARADVGQLVKWKISATGKAAGGTTPPPATTVTRSFSNAQRVEIPDNSAAGASSAIDVPEGITINELSFELDIRHSYRGDLRVVVEHDGVSKVLHDKAGGSADDVRGSWAADEWNGKDARGTWTLKVVDVASQDVGAIVSWKLTVTGVQR